MRRQVGQAAQIRDGGIPQFVGRVGLQQRNSLARFALPKSDGGLHRRRVFHIHEDIVPSRVLLPLRLGRRLGGIAHLRFCECLVQG